MNLNEEYWHYVCKYIPPELKKDIEQEQWICSYPKKAKMTTLGVRRENGPKNSKEVPAEELNKNWFITPHLDEKGEQTKFFTLSHISGFSITENLRSRRDVLRLWAKIKDIVTDVEKIAEFEKMKEYQKLRLIVRDFKDTH